MLFYTKALTGVEITGVWSVHPWQMVVDDQRGKCTCEPHDYDVIRRVLKIPQFTIFICVLFILPTVTPVNQLNMNYAIVAIGGVVLLVGIVWITWGRFRFSGPAKTLVNQENFPETDNKA